MTIGNAIMEPMQVHKILENDEQANTTQNTKNNKVY